MIALGLTIGVVLQGRIQARALHETEQLTRVFSQLAVVPNLSSADLERPLRPAKVRALDAALGGIEDAHVHLVHAHVFAADGTTAYSDDRTRIGTVAAGEGLERALGGALVSEVERVGDDGEKVRASLEVYVPLRLPGGPDVDGVTELYVDYGPTAASVHDDTRALYLLLGGGMTLLYLSLFVIVKVASRRLRDQAMYDTLTGLPNRIALYDRVGRAGHAPARRARAPVRGARRHRAARGQRRGRAVP